MLAVALEQRNCCGRQQEGGEREMEGMGAEGGTEGGKQADQSIGGCWWKPLAISEPQGRYCILASCP